MQHHIIRKQYLHVEVNGTESDGLTLQRNLPSLCQHWLIPAIERALDRCTPQDGHLHIERLEIDVGTMALGRLDQDIADSVAQAVEKSLREQILSSQSSQAIISGNLQHKTAQLSINEAFIYFLTTGSLPWSFSLPEGNTLEQVILRSWVEPAGASLDQITEDQSFLSVLASDTVRKRLIRQFSPAFLKILLAQLSSRGKKIMFGILQALNSSSGPSVETKKFERHLWETVFTHILKDKVFTTEGVVCEAWSNLTFTKGGHNSLAIVLESHWPDITRKSSEPINRVKSSEQISPATSEPQNKSIEIIEHSEAREGIYIENAGLVILHPFLPRFFEALDIAAAERLLQPERALCLLHFLTTGQSFAPEYELVLPKILCNVPLETPVESDMALTTTEQEEAIALLEAVIRHWEALRNTSPDGLRGTFLLRSGKLSLREDSDWLLQVESNAFDILLDQLPLGMGISMIKLPWMKTMLWVEWR